MYRLNRKNSHSVWASYYLTLNNATVQSHLKHGIGLINYLLIVKWPGQQVIVIYASIFKLTSVAWERSSFHKWSLSILLNVFYHLFVLRMGAMTVTFYARANTRSSGVVNAIFVFSIRFQQQLHHQGFLNLQLPREPIWVFRSTRAGDLFIILEKEKKFIRTQWQHMQHYQLILDNTCFAAHLNCMRVLMERPCHSINKHL